MKRLQRDIQAQAALIAEDRQLLRLHVAAALGHGRRALATPAGLAGGFGIGLLLGLWRRKPAPPAEQGEPRHGRGEPSPLLRWALRDLVLPLVLSWIGQKSAQNDPEQAPPYGYPDG